MKNSLIAFSVALNVVLIAVVIKYNMAARPMETIVETHADHAQDEVSTALAANKRVVIAETSPAATVADPSFAEEPNETHEKMETERMAFLTRDLKMDPEKLQTFQKLRNEYFQKTSKLWNTNPYGELSFKERRNMLEMEEKLHHDLVELMGEEDWKRYSQFREAYNKRGFEKQIEENVPFLFMGL